MDEPTTLPKFNPSGKKEVDEIKRMSEELMQYIIDKVPANERRHIALVNYEQATMWAVKALFT